VTLEEGEKWKKLSYSSELYYSVDCTPYLALMNLASRPFQNLRFIPGKGWQPAWRPIEIRGLDEFINKDNSCR